MLYLDQGEVKSQTNTQTEDFHQERAKLKYANPKYIADVVVFTGRKSRHDPYLTNMTGTLLMPYGNNVTFATTLTLKSGGDFRIESKVCETIKYKWMNEFMSSFTNLSLKKCPFPAARYTYINMELPPKNIPLPIADGDYWIKFELYLTSTKEPILEIDTLLHFDKTKKNSKKNKKGKH
ncbi:unnamed protein product [Arctia plantaginis]|uniref:Uncharacterized protein n=1 Tax=Arctia plantaginis TaxID=874455 RepID=A0A8S1A8I2_ARCPL|nr:unnamed protein product [Arctia plantaginis]CAB3260475.1 unnamed protein product [Arctia plantaginis]